MGSVSADLRHFGYRLHIDTLWAEECRHRNVRRLLETLPAEQALKQGTDEELDQLARAIIDVNLESVKAGIKAINKGKGLDSKSAQDLRKIASSLRIRNYSRMSKDQLIFQIGKRRKELKIDSV